ncbi:MAG: ABC transporter ATP-binding protein [Myxococcales bacterium]|nr:ABC transporter ATP-binding protein [Myxococcales bacterium]
MIEVEGVSRRFGDLVAVRDVSFRIERGEVVGLLGPNGAGKTTVMRILTGFLPASEGSVRVAGHRLDSDGIAARREIGYLPETPPLYPEMRVESYLRYAATIQDVPRSVRGARVEHALARCGLREVQQRVIRTLSKGFRQRVGLAQAIVHEPKVLVLDEPTSGLDPVQVLEIRRLISTLAQDEGRTVILSTHILPEVEAICRRVLLIADGSIRVDGSLEEVRGTDTLEAVFLREAAGRSERPDPGEAPDGERSA